MKKKARNSLIVVVLVVILGLGFGIWKIFFAPKPLKIKDLENMHITKTIGSGEVWNFYVFGNGTTLEWASLLGDIYDNQNIFDNGDASEDWVPVVLYTEPCGEMPIPAGYTIEITYDSGKALTIYLPEMSYENDINLYVATDGSTYYNRWLTKLAQSAPEPGEVEERGWER